MGELLVHHLLKKLPKKRYKILRNIMVETHRGTSQIDNIVLSAYGIFVIETKAYRGWIYGNEYWKFWTQNIYGNKYKFQNPLHQNYGHIKSLEEVTGINENRFVSIIAFSGEASLKNQVRNVVNISGLLELIKTYKEPILTKEEVRQAYYGIKFNNIVSPKKRREHVREIRKKYKTSN